MTTVDGSCRPLVAASGKAQAEPDTDAPATACPMPAFPGAEGFGMYATGGRGGAVVVVTSPANSGPGTLRWAVEELKGPRTILFAVRRIHLEKNVTIRRGNVTIAGQSAGGVEITGSGITIRASNVIMRGMLMRPGDTENGADPGNRDALTVSAGKDTISHVIVDHNSFEWALDENVTFYRHVTDMTFSSNIVAQALYDSIHPSGLMSKGLLLHAGGGMLVPERITIKGNLIAYNNARNPWVKHGREIEIINNYIFAPGEQHRAVNLGDYRSDNYSTPQPMSVNVIGNYYEAGPETRKISDPPIRLHNKAEGAYYVARNLQFDRSGRPIRKPFHGLAKRDAIDREAFTTSIAAIDDPATVKASILKNAGANPADRDPIDRRLIEAVIRGKGGLVDSVEDAGGYAPLPPFKLPADSDGDGLPDAFEALHDSDIAPEGDEDGDGYTNIEEYLNGFYTGLDIMSDPAGCG
ncbi:MAG: hypothetical protein OEN23_17640 [Paracoccaceae bacterium]|nr:hypothetical protein [Paracoccaceae bacterium]